MHIKYMSGSLSVATIMKNYVWFAFMLGYNDTVQS